MFSQTDLVQFVFANEMDCLFWGNIFKTNLTKYLFFKLHEKFDIVYFIDIEDEKPYVFHYGELEAKKYKKKTLRSYTNSLGEWMLEQLKRKQKCAVVCKLHDFCCLFENEEKVLREIAEAYKNRRCHGAIILVASHNVDKSRNYLLKSPVFNSLGETSVLGLRSSQMIENIYSVLKTNKQEACVFLNSYTRDKIKELVTYVALRENRYCGEKKIGYISDYLTMYLNSTDMQMREYKIFKSEMSLICPNYEEIYKNLQNEELWKLLYKRSSEHKNNYPDKYEDEAIDSITKIFCITYDDNSIENKCMKLCCPGMIRDYENNYDDRMIVYLNKIFDKVSKPGNREANAQISKEIDSMITKFNNSYHNKDKNTCTRILSTVLFWVNWLYADEKKVESIMKIVQTLDDYIKLSEYHFKLSEQYKESSVKSALQSQKINYIAEKLGCMDEIIDSSKVSLIESDIIEKMTNIMEKYEKDDNSMFDFNSNS